MKARSADTEVYTVSFMKSSLFGSSRLAIGTNLRERCLDVFAEDQQKDNDECGGNSRRPAMEFPLDLSREQNIMSNKVR